MQLKSLFLLAILSFFLFSCDSGVKFNNPNDINSDAYNPESGENETNDEDIDQTDSDSTDSEPEDTEHDNPDSIPEQPDNGDSEPDDTDTYDSDSVPDNSDSTPDDDADTADSIDDSSDSQPDDSDTTDDGDTSAPDEDDTEPDEEPTTRTAACQSKPDNTVWNTVSEITQTYTGSGWQPSTTPVYNETPSESECRYKCASGYNWNGNSCTDSSVSGSLTLGNICTGQTSCYNASSSMTCPTSSSADFFGQDAQYAAQGICTPQNFTVQTISSQKVVLDNNTGLMWQQTIPTSTYTWANAVSYCENLEYAGYTDWRLPTPKELLTIVDNSRYKPVIDTTYFPNTPSSYFWSSSTHAYDTNDAWLVDFSYGSVYGNYKTGNLYVRCVRGAALPTGSFTSSTIQGDVIVTDTETGPIWQKTYVSGKTWQQALSYCESLTYAGYSDWRLPNKNELASLINYEKYSPASDFPDMPSNYFWSSSTGAHNTNYAWRVSFNNGYVGYSNKTDDVYVRCVRKELPECSASSGTPCKDSTNHLTWSPLASNDMTQPNALNYCENLVLYGFSDWHLPTIDELRTLIKNCPGTETNGACAISEKNGKLSGNDYSDDCSCAYKSGSYYSKIGDDNTVSPWSSSTRSDDTNRAWYVGFFAGVVSNSDKTSVTSDVRCVR